MTQPTFAKGYPDWIRTQQRQTPLIVNHPQGNINSGTVFGPFYVGYLDTLTIQVNVPAGGLAVRVDWSDGATGTAVLSQLVQVRAGQGAVVVRPLIADTVTFTVTTDTGGVRSAQLLVIGGYGNGQLLVNPGAGPFLAATDQNVGAGATTAVDAAQVVDGPVCYEWATAATVWTMSLLAVDYTGTANRIVSVDSARGAPQTGSINFFAPAQPLRVNLHNGDAGAKLFDAYVTSLRG